MRARQVDVARSAGVSQAAVSMALGEASARSRMSERTRRRILESAASLGYSVDPVARNLVGGRNRLLGVYTFEAVFPTEVRDFYQEFFLGIERAAEVAGYDLLLFTSASLPGQRRGIYAGGVNRLSMSDGSILLGRNDDKQEIERLCAEGFPFVYIGRRETPSAEMSYVTADYAEATARVAQHLVDLGHTRIAYVRTAPVSEPDVDRAEGWSRVAGRLGDDTQVVRGDSVLDAERVAALSDAGVTALVVEDPQAASHIFAAAGRAELLVPDDLSIAVLGDDPATTPQGGGWTGFSIPREAMGRAAVGMLLEMLDEPEPRARRLSLPCVFTPGTTAAPPADVAVPAGGAR